MVFQVHFLSLKGRLILFSFNEKLKLKVFFIPNGSEEDNFKNQIAKVAIRCKDNGVPKSLLTQTRWCLQRNGGHRRSGSSK